MTAYSRALGGRTYRFGGPENCRNGGCYPLSAISRALGQT